jgi:serine/threonine protein kinase
MDTNNLPPNSPLGHFVILSKIAEGGMGIVYKAFETQLERNVAIKVLRAEYATDPIFKKSFQEEARAVAALSHPNIVPIHFIGEVEEVIFFSMGFISGETFEDWIERKCFFGEDEAFWFMYQAVSALDYAHRLNIIHLDIKPSNFLIDSASNIFLTDFGLAERLTRDKDEAQVQKGFGTPLYASPEQILRQPTDHRSDIYSLGIMLYYMMVGRLPVVGDSAMEIVKSHIYNPFPAEDARKAGVPKAWVQLLERMLAKELDQRIASYTELYNELESLRGLKGVHAIEYPARVIISTAVVNWTEMEKKPQTAELMKRDLDLMLTLCERFEGKILKTVANGRLLSFNKSDNAVKWALELQEVFNLQAQSNKNALVHRMGMHYGEFTIEGQKVYGLTISGAELAQSKAAPGTVCITSSVLELLSDSSKFITVAMGEAQIELEIELDNGLLKLFSIARPPPPAPVKAPEPEAPVAKPAPKPSAPPSAGRLFIYAASALILMLCILAALIYLAVSSQPSDTGILDIIFPKK